MTERLGIITLWILVALGVLLISRFVFLSIFSKPPATLGLHDGRLAPCPSKRNCVSSTASGRSHSIAPLAASGSQDEAMASAREAIEGMPGARIVTVDGPYLHAEFTSPLFRFVDDLELLWNGERQVLDVRSASRVGNSDLGVNRKRVEVLRRRLIGD
ncbi:MAG: DUF1499 domain-containing protein [Acidobacteriota bacterium]|nr:DUF1499 domain-containing protein [Acidobacteriota bacterium]